MDLIDRQAAIDTATEYEKQLCEILGDENELAEAVKILKHRIIALQPSQPEIIYCKDCAKRNAMGYCTIFQNNIHGVATSWYKPKDDDFCSYVERRTDTDMRGEQYENR